MESCQDMKKALLLSGGIDSLSILYWKKPDLALTIDYGQNSAQAEINASAYVCKKLNINHHVLEIDCSKLGSGDMSGIIVSKIAPQSDWWPFRNQLLITLASMYLIKFDVKTIMIGSVSTDKQFKDGTDNFTYLLNKLISYQEGGITIEAPAIQYTSSQLVKLSGIPLSLLSVAHSCYKKNVACGKCRGCQKYMSVMDPLIYNI